MPMGRTRIVTLCASLCLFSGCTSASPDSRDGDRVKLAHGIAISVPPGFSYRARLADGTIEAVPATANSLPAGVPDPMAFGQPFLDLVLMKAPGGMDDAEQDVDFNIIFLHQANDVPAVHRHLSTNLESIGRKIETAGKDDALHDQFAARISLKPTEIDGFPAVDDAWVAFDPHDTFKTRPYLKRTIEIYRPDGTVDVNIDFYGAMPADSEGTPRTWTPADGSPLAGDSALAHRLDAMVMSISVASP